MKNFMPVSILLVLCLVFGGCARERARGPRIDTDLIRIASVLSVAMVVFTAMF